MQETEFWLAFHRIPGVGSRKLRDLYSHFGSLEAAWTAPLSALERVPGIGRETAIQIQEGRTRLAPSALLHEIEQAGIWTLTWPEEGYPASLRSLDDPPAILYGRGKLPSFARVVALVGTRKATDYGRKVAEELAMGLAGQGVCVASGLAAGIDAAAHWGAIGAGGETVAVLGCGPDIVYPRENRSLFGRILEVGTILSEYPPGTAPLAGHFPARNRIVSALASFVLVVEAPMRSGALITADLALEQGKEVGAVPGPIDAPQSAGANHLISQGARVVTRVEDILSEMGWSRVREDVPLPSPEKEILAALDRTPRHLDEISRGLGLPPAVVTSALVMLELKSLAIRLPGQRYMRRTT